VDEGVDAGGAGVEREPGGAQHPGLTPEGAAAAVHARQMLGERRQQHVPVLVTRWGRLVGEQSVTGLDRLPAVLLQELGDVPPASCTSVMAS
jgi:hypothetical protein